MSDGRARLTTSFPLGSRPLKLISFKSKCHVPAQQPSSRATPHVKPCPRGAESARRRALWTANIAMIGTDHYAGRSGRGANQFVKWRGCRASPSNTDMVTARWVQRSTSWMACLCRDPQIRAGINLNDLGFLPIRTRTITNTRSTGFPVRQYVRGCRQKSSV
ncbi:hypothetical protein KCP76_23860 [Salmonella enterica subsp. enterica serovar Weltevreden]|nr:hypothetical protein KCP76_23860 [Salmonella enterica subsp. enterica serovar Weltevreden]